MDMSQYRDLFLSETREHLSRMNDLVVALEQDPEDVESINALFREAHSVKGMAATMGFQQTAQLAHHLEDSLDKYRCAGKLADDAADLLLGGIDLLEGLVDDIAADHPERDTSEFLAEYSGTEQAGQAATAPLQPPAEMDSGEAGLETLVVVEQEESDAGPESDVSPEPDTFQVQIALSKDAAVPAARGLLILRELENRGEIVSSDPDKEALLAGRPFDQIKTWFRTTLARQHVQELILAFPDVAEVDFVEDRRNEKSAKSENQARTVRVRTDLLDRFVSLAGELITHRHMLRNATRGRDWDAVEGALEQTSRLVNDLHHHVLRTRLMPLESITGRLPRLVRDLGRKQGKQLTFRMIGGEVGLDRVILDHLADPLVHLVRNAVDHGIREAGEIMVNARRERDLVLLEVRDNGVGIDPAVMRQKAVKNALLSQSQAEALSDRDALLLICRPGFSTAAEVTETSGRGVGMDIVKSEVENLGGTLEIESAPQKGTIFRLRLPLSIAIIKLILVRCGGFPLALPVTRVQRIIECPSDQLELYEGSLCLSLDEERIPLVALSALLGLEASVPGPTVCIVLAQLHGSLAGMLVDGFIGHRDAFVKSLGFPLNLLGGLSGATVEGDGSVLFVVDPHPLLADWATAHFPGFGRAHDF